MATIQAVNIGQRVAITDDGRTLPITNMFDASGAETSDPDEVLACVVGAGDEWFTIVLSDFEDVTLN